MHSHTVQWGLFIVSLLVAFAVLAGVGYILGKWYTERSARERKTELHNRAMFERSFLRPKDFFHLRFREQVMIDRKLGILGWHGKGMTKSDWRRFKNHYANWDGVKVRFEESRPAKESASSFSPTKPPKAFVISQINRVEQSFGDSLK